METNSQDNESDSIRLLQIFPKEIWILILDKFQCVEDLERLSVTSHFLKSLIRPRHQFAFVWPILASYLERQVEHNSNFLLDGDEDYLKLRWTMNLRQTCKLWKQTMDQYLQNLQGNLSTFLRLSLTEIKYQEDNSNNRAPAREQKKTPTRFLEQFEGNHLAKNPFPSSCVSVDLSFNTAERPAQNSNILLLFSKFGRHIQFLHVSIDYRLSRGEKYYFILKKLLKFTPKLKRLTCRVYVATSDFKQLSKFIQANPLQVNRNLETVVFEGIPFSIAKEILEKNPQIRDVRGFPPKYYKDIPKNSLQLLKNVKKLELEVDYTPDLEKLENWPDTLALEELDLKFGLQTFQVTWPRAFAFVEKFGQATLQKVNLALPRHGNELFDRLDNARLNLSNISELRLKVDYKCNLDFLLAMRSTLRKLCIYVNLWGRSEDALKNQVLRLEGKCIQFWQFLENPLNSNIWVQLNNLNCLVVDPEGYGEHEKTYLRRDYNLAMRNASRFD